MSGPESILDAKVRNLLQVVEQLPPVATESSQSLFAQTRSPSRSGSVGHGSQGLPMPSQSASSWNGRSALPPTRCSA